MWIPANRKKRMKDWDHHEIRDKRHKLELENFKVDWREPETPVVTVPVKRNPKAGPSSRKVKKWASKEN